MLHGVRGLIRGYADPPCLVSHLLKVERPASHDLVDGAVLVESVFDAVDVQRISHVAMLPSAGLPQRPQSGLHEKDREREQAFNAWMEARRAERAAAARYWALADPV